MASSLIRLLYGRFSLRCPHCGELSTVERPVTFLSFVPRFACCHCGGLCRPRRGSIASVFSGVLLGSIAGLVGYLLMSNWRIDVFGWPALVLLPVMILLSRVIDQAFLSRTDCWERVEKGDKGSGSN
jgi:uncharacterized protein (DUF983 family)